MSDDHHERIADREADRLPNTGQSKAYRLDGFPESIGAALAPCEIVWQGAVHANVGVLLRVTGIHGRFLYVEPVEPLCDLTDKEIGKAWRSVKATLPYPEYRRAITKAILEAARKK